MSRWAFLSLIFWLALGISGCITPPPKPNEPPIASFDADPMEGVVPLAVQFDASKSADSDGKIVDYRWDFGDTTTGTGEIISHTYSSPGQYTVTLVVKDDKGAEGSFKRTIFAREKEKPVVKQLKDQTENDYVILERTYPSEVKVGEEFSIALKATAKVDLVALLVREEIRPDGPLKLIDGDLKGGDLNVSRGKSVRISYTLKATGEGKPEVRGRALFTLQDGTGLDLPLKTTLDVKP